MNDHMKYDGGTSDKQEMDAWQEVMHRTYEKWPIVKKKHYDGEEYEQHVSYPDFIDSLPENEAKAVVIGNFNYQVQNGGFSQWYENGYYECVDLLRTALEGLEQNEGVQKALDLLAEAEDTIGHYTGAADAVDKAARYSEYDALDYAKEEIRDLLMEKMHDQLHDLDTKYYEIDDQIEKTTEAWVRSWDIVIPDEVKRD